MIRHLNALLVLLAFSSAANAAGQWTLTTADFHTQSVSVQSIDSGGVHVVSGGGEARVIPFDQFLDVSRAVTLSPPSGKFELHFVGNDQISGEPVSIKGNDLIWKSSTLGQIALPMKKLVAMVRPAAHFIETRAKEDVVTLANGDTVRGIIADISATQVTVQTENGNSAIPLGSISQISFAAVAGSGAPENGFRVHLDDGSSIVATTLKVADANLELSLGKNSTITIDLARVASIEQVNGPVSWLSARPTLENVYIPFIGSPQTGAAKMDRNWTGEDPIHFGAQQFTHGIGVHSYSRLAWDVTGFEAFRTRYAIDTKEPNTRADVTVRILLDDKVIYEQPHVRAGTLSPVIVEELKGAKKLTLEVDYGDNMDTQDRMNWIEAALLKHKPG